MASLPTEREVINRFESLKREMDAICGKLNELELERQEHALVLETLVPLAEGRRCFRLVGGVLVERTVGEVRPLVQRNKEELEEVRRFSLPHCEHCAPHTRRACAPRRARPPARRGAGLARRLG